jgi:hypothetical protein
VNFLSREALLGATGCPEEAVFVAGLKAHLVVRGLTGAALDTYHQGITVGKGAKRDVNMKNLRTKLLVLSLFTAVPGKDGTLVGGERLLRDGDEERLSQIRGDVIGQLFPIAQRLSGMSDEEVEELGKPSSTTDSATSSSS